MDNPKWGLQDFIAYTLAQVYNQSKILSYSKLQYVTLIQILTFSIALLAIFASLSPLAKEIIVLYKVVIISLGDKLSEPIKLIVYITTADISKWPTLYIKAVNLLQKFIKD